LEQRFEVSLGLGGFGVGSCSLRFAGQAEGLCERELSVVVVWGGVKRGAEMSDGRRGVVPA
jgi:hypothetical protein